MRNSVCLCAASDERQQTTQRLSQAASRHNGDKGALRSGNNILVGSMMWHGLKESKPRF